MEYEIIQIIKDKLTEVVQVQEVILHPDGKDIVQVVDGKNKIIGSRIKKYPAVILFKDNFDNAFADTGSNEMAIRFTGWLLIKQGNADSETIWEEILPRAMDGLIKVFNGGWDFGTINGHRIWARLSSGVRGYTVEDKGVVVWEQFELLVRGKTDI